MPATKNRRPATIAGCAVYTFDAAFDAALEDMINEIAPGGSMMYIGGSGTAHHVNAVITPGNCVCRTGDMDRAATVAAHNRFGMVTIAVPAFGAFEVWAV